MAENFSRYSSWSRWLKDRCGTKVSKICLDSGSGCPNREGIDKGGCIFCNSLGGGSGAFLRGEDLESQIRHGFDRLYRTRGSCMALLYFQSYSTTNTTPEQFRQTIEKAISISQKLGRVAGLAVGARPDQVPEKILDIMESAGEKHEIDIWLELGVQTIDPESLIWLKRGHGPEETDDALARSVKRKIFICAHLISGIPGEKAHQLGRSSSWLAERGVHAVKFHPLHVLKGSALEKLFLDGAFVPVTLENYVSEVVHALRVLPGHILIQRLSADASSSQLVAPEWIGDKTGCITMIRKRMTDLNATQGDMSNVSSGL